MQNPVNLRSRNPETHEFGGLLRQIEISMEHEMEININDPDNTRRITFPYEVNVNLIFADGQMHMYTGFNANITSLGLADWSLLEGLYDGEEFPTIPVFQAGGAAFKLASISFVPELAYFYGDPDETYDESETE